MVEGLTPSPLFVARSSTAADVRRWDRRERGPDGPRLSDSPRRLVLGHPRVGRRRRRGRPGAAPSPRSTADGAEARRDPGAAPRRRARHGLDAQEVRLTLTASASLTAASAHDGRAVLRALRRRPRFSTVYERATATADWHGLDLSRRQRDAFSGESRAQATDAALPGLRDRLAAALAREAARCLSAQVR